MDTGAGTEPTITFVGVVPVAFVIKMLAAETDVPLVGELGLDVVRADVSGASFVVT